MHAFQVSSHSDFDVSHGQAGPVSFGPEVMFDGCINVSISHTSLFFLLTINKKSKQSEWSRLGLTFESRGKRTSTN